jgi:hypothetical protein
VSNRLLDLVRNVDKKKAGISSHAAHLLGLLADHHGAKGCFPGQDTLAAESGMSVRNVRRYLEELRRNGFLEWSQATRTEPNRYEFNEAKLAASPKVPKKSGGQQWPTDGRPAVADRGRTDSTPRAANGVPSAGQHWPTPAGQRWPTNPQGTPNIQPSGNPRVCAREPESFSNSGETRAESERPTGLHADNIQKAKARRALSRKPSEPVLLADVGEPPPKPVSDDERQAKAEEKQRQHRDPANWPQWMRDELARGPGC